MVQRRDPGEPPRGRAGSPPGQGVPSPRLGPAFRLPGPGPEEAAITKPHLCVRDGLLAERLLLHKGLYNGDLIKVNQLK